MKNNNFWSFIVCVTSYLLDGWTDLHETFGVYNSTRDLHGVLIHFRWEARNRKYVCFRKRKSEPEREDHTLEFLSEVSRILSLLSYLPNQD